MMHLQLHICSDSSLLQHDIFCDCFKFMNHGFHHGLQFVLLTLRYLIRRLNLSIGWHPALKLSRQYSGDNSCIYLCVSGRWFAIFRSQRASSSTGTRILPNNKSKEGNSGLSLSLPWYILYFGARRLCKNRKGNICWNVFSRVSFISLRPNSELDGSC
ncbi:uncharacterized protein LOC141697392 isoform X2 [Apium graveolens]|uniref:uncharacterized protein LOC141697392 isoform X2 n=1 Tax=Apium graveolens TaxID=4045 RepID=UPI003D79EFBD